MNEVPDLHVDIVVPSGGGNRFRTRIADFRDQCWQAAQFYCWPVSQPPAVDSDQVFTVVDRFLIDFDSDSISANMIVLAAWIAGDWFRSFSMNCVSQL